MLLALFIYLAANQGVLVAQPIVINTIAIGSVVESATHFARGQESMRIER